MKQGHSPCAMEISGAEVAWDSCTAFNHDDNRERLAEFLSLVRVFPNDPRLEEKGRSKGWGGHEWFRAVMGREF
jgi:hypothetical protein